MAPFPFSKSAMEGKPNNLHPLENGKVLKMSMGGAGIYLCVWGVVLGCWRRSISSRRGCLSVPSDRRRVRPPAAAAGVASSEHTAVSLWGIFQGLKIHMLISFLVCLVYMSCFWAIPICLIFVRIRTALAMFMAVQCPRLG